PKPDPTPTQTLPEARKGFRTKIVSDGDPPQPPDKTPNNGQFELVNYDSPVGSLPAYLTKDPKDGIKHPAIIWITGGDCNAISDVWTQQPRNNDQTAVAFRRRGVVMMFPSLRGGNVAGARREGFYGEVDDILAATDFLEKLDYVDPTQIYLGGH